MVNFFTFGCSQFGASLNEDDISRIKNSSNYDKKEKIFLNQDRDAAVRLRARFKGNYLSMIKDFFKTRKDEKPDFNFPEKRSSLSDFSKASEKVKIIWMGHSTFLLNINQKMILIDPVFSNTASPFSFTTKRFQESVYNLKELPSIDYIVISHDHYDHLDMETIKFFKKSKTRFFLPLGVGAHLLKWGIQKERIFEFDWWDKKTFEGIDFIATPAQHSSGRGIFDQNSTLWSSWILKSSTQSIYYSGDSGYADHFKEIGDKYGPFDAAIMETGQYNKLWHEVHMLPKEWAKAYTDLGAKTYIPAHWGMFQLSLDPWHEPINQLFMQPESVEMNIQVPFIGETLRVGESYNTSKWWVKS